MDYGFVLDPGETIERVVRRSIFDVLPMILLSLVLATSSAGLAFLLGRFPDSTPFPPWLTATLIITMLVIAAVIFLVSLYVYQHNLLIFTNTHLVMVEQLALFQRRVSQLDFTKVEDVTGRKTGFLQTIFNYGNVEIQSAAEREKFIFKNAPNPTVVADEALQIHQECLRRAAASPND